MGQRLHVKYDAAKLTASAIAAAVADAGHARLARARGADRVGRVGQPDADLAARSRSGGTLAAGLLGDVSRRAGRARPRRCSLLSIAAGVPLTARKAWQALRLGRSTSTC